MKILVVGSVAYDAVETPAGKRDSQLGGSASYFSTAASYFADVGLIGVVGDDFDPADRAMLDDLGIDTSGLIEAEGKTFRWVGTYTDDINTAVTLDTQLNVFAEFEPALSNEHASAPYLFLANIDPNLQLKVLGSMNSRPKMVACDTMNLWIDIARPALVDLVGRVDTLLINEGEAKQLTGDENVVSALPKLHKLGPRYVIVKKGEHGSILSSRRGLFVAPAFPLAKVEDPTGAGDSFVGAMVGYLAKTGGSVDANIRKAILYGSVVASFCCEGFGLNRTTKTTRSEINQRLRALEKMTRA